MMGSPCSCIALSPQEMSRVHSQQHGKELGRDTREGDVRRGREAVGGLPQGDLQGRAGEQQGQRRREQRAGRL